MKAVFEYNLEDNRDRAKYLVATKAQDLLQAVDDFAQHLRTAVKYRTDTMSEEQIEAYTSIREIFYATLLDNGINLDELHQ